MKIEEQINLYLDWCKLEADFTYQTIETKKYVLNRFARQVKINQSSDFTLEKFKEWRDGMLSGRLTGRKHAFETINTRVRIVRAFFRWIEDMKIDTLNIRIINMRGVRTSGNVKKYQYFSRDEINYIIKSVANEKKLEAAMISLFFDSGLRGNELKNLKISDLNFQDRNILVCGKGRKWGYVYFTAKTEFLIKEYIKSRGLSQNDFLWQSSEKPNIPFTIKAIRCKLKRVFEGFGYDDFTLHQLRHSFATDLLDSGIELYEIQELLRHSKIETTKIYVHNLQKKVHKAYIKAKDEEMFYVDFYNILAKKPLTF